MWDLKTVRYVVALLVVLAGSAYVIAGWQGILAAFASGTVAYLLVPEIPSHVLARLRGARRVLPSQMPDLYRLLRSVVQGTDLRKLPGLMVFPSPTLNAFAVGGRDDSVIAVSTACLHRLSPSEMTAILGHELGHIVNGDSRLTIMSETLRLVTALTALLGTALLIYLMMRGYGVFIPVWVALVFTCGPWVALWLHSRLLRHRELLADRFAVRVMGDERPMLQVLHRLYEEQEWGRFLGVMRLPSGLKEWFATHPPLTERLGALSNRQVWTGHRYPRRIHIRYL